MRILIALLLACSTAFGQKISDLTVATSAADTNTIPIVVSPNVANGLKQITVANLFSGRGGDAGGTNSRQFGSLNLTNWSNIPTGAMANVVSTTFLTNLAGLFSAANSNLSYAIGTAGTNYTLTASNLVRLVAGLEATNHANAILQSATNYANSVGSGGGLTTNANQFLGVPLAIKDGALLTNTTTYGASFAGSGVGTVRIYDNAQTEYSQLEAPFDVQTNNVFRMFSNATAGVVIAGAAGTGTNQGYAQPITTGVFFSPQAGSANFTNAPTIDTLTLSSNLTINVPVLDNVATNSTANSNLTMNAVQGERDIYVTNNLSLTNFSNLPGSGQTRQVTWAIHPQLVNRSLVLPTLGGPQFGVQLFTNKDNQIPSTLLPTTNYILGIKWISTNGYISVTEWK